MARFINPQNYLTSTNTTPFNLIQNLQEDPTEKYFLPQTQAYMLPAAVGKVRMPSTTMDTILDPANWSPNRNEIESDDEYQSKATIQMGGFGAGWLGEDTATDAIKRATLGYAYGPYFKLPENSAMWNQLDYEKTISNAQLELKKEQEAIKGNKSAPRQVMFQGKMTNVLDIPKLPTQEEYNKQIEDLEINTNAAAWVFSTKANAKKTGLPIVGYLVDLFYGSQDSIDSTKAGKIPLTLAHVTDVVDVETPSGIVKLSEDLYKHLAVVEPNFDGAAWFESLPLTPDIRLTLSRKGITPMSFVGSVGSNEAKFRLLTTVSKTTLAEEIEQYSKNEQTIKREFVSENWSRITNFGSMIISGPDTAVALIALSAGLTVKGVSTAVQGLSVAARATALGSTLGTASRAVNYASIGYMAAQKAATAIALVDLASYASKLNWVQRLGLTMTGAAIQNLGANYKIQQSRIAWTMAGLTTEAQTEYDAAEGATAALLGAGFGAGLFGAGVLLGAGLRALRPNKLLVVEPQEQANVVELTVRRLEGPRPIDVDGSESTAFNRGNILPNNRMYSEGSGIRNSTDIPSGPRPSEPNVTNRGRLLPAGTQTQEPLSTRETIDGVASESNVPDTLNPIETAAVRANQTSERASLAKNADDNTVSSAPESATFARATGETNEAYAARLIAADQVDGVGDLIRLVTTDEERMALSGTTLTPLEKINKLKEYFARARELVNTLAKEVPDGSNPWFKAQLRRLKLAEDNLVIEEFKATRTQEEQDGTTLTPNEKQASVGEVAAPKRSVNIPKLDPKQTKLAKAAYRNIEVARNVSETHAKLIDYLTAKLERTGLSSSHITESLRMLAAVVVNMKLDPTRVTGFIKNSGGVPELAYSTPMGQLFVNINRMVENNTTNMGKVEVTKLSMDIAVTVAHEIGHIFSHFLDPAEQLKIYYLYAETVDLDTAFRIENGLYNVANVSEFFANAYQAGVVAQTVEALSTPNSNIAITIGKALLNMLKTVVSALTPKDITAINVILKMVEKLEKSVTKLKHTVRGRVVLARALQKTLLSSVKNKKVSTLREHISYIAKKLERENLPANLVSRLEKISSDKTLKANVIKEQVFNLVMGIENFSTENLISVIKALGGTEKKIVVNIPFALDLLEKHVSDFNFKKTEVNNIALAMLLLPDSINEIISSISLLETVDPSISMSTNFANLIDIQSRYKLIAFMSALPDMAGIIIDDVRTSTWVGKDQGGSAIDAFAMGFKRAQQYKITNPNKIEPISSKDASDYLANDSIGQFVGQSLNGNERGEIFIDDMLTLVHQTYGISFDSVLRIEDAFNDPTIPQARRNFITKLLSDDTIPHPFLSVKDVIKDSQLGGDLHLAIQTTWKEQGNVYNVTDEMFQANLKKLMPVIAKEALQLKSYKAIAFRAVQLALDESILDSISVYNASRISKKNTVFTKRVATQGEIDVKITEKFTVLEEQLKQLKGNVAAARTIMATADADVLAQFEWITGPEFIGEVNKILKLQESDLKVLQDNFTTPEALLESLDNSLLQGVDGVSSQLQFNSILQTIIPEEIRPAVKKKTAAIRKKVTPNISIVKAPVGSKGTAPVVKEDIVSILAKTYSPSELMLAKLQDPAYLGKVVGYVKRTMNYHDAEDMVNKLFIDLLENAEHYNTTFPDITSASKLGKVITHGVKRIKSNESKKGEIESIPKLDAEGMPVRNEQGKIEYTKQKRDVKDVDNVNAVATDTSFTNLDTNENDLMMFAVSENIIPVSATVKADLLVILSDKRSGNVSNLGDGTGVPNSTRVATVVRSYRKALDKFKKENDITTQEDLIEALATLHSKKTAKKTIPASAVERKSVTSAEMNKAKDLSIQKVKAEQDAKNALNNEPSKLSVAIPVASGTSQALNTTLAADSTTVPAGTLLVEGTVAVSPAANKAVLIATLDANRKSLVLTPIVETPLEGNYRPNVISWSKNYFGNRKASDGSLVWQNFVKWFGDSKVVDADGNPLVVYHGTDSIEDFTSFKESVTGRYGKGNYFTTNSIIAEKFVRDVSDFNKEKKQRIIPVFVSIKNPYVSEKDDFFTENMLIKLGLTFKDYHNRAKEIHAKTFTKLDRLKGKSLEEFDDAKPAAVTSLLQDAGFDGIQVNFKIADFTNPSRILKEYSYFIAFESSQSKSSIANSGEFSLTNPNILDANRKSLVLAPVTTTGKIPVEVNKGQQKTLVDLLENTHDSVFTKLGLSKENVVSSVKDSNYPHDVLTRILQTKGIQSYEITSGDNNLVFITSDKSATITSVVDLTPTLSQEARPVTAPSKELAVRQEPNLEREVLPQDESDNVITEPVIKEIESDAPVLTPSEKFISEELTNVDGLRESGMDPSFSKLLLHRFHKAIGFTESVLNTVDSIPPEFNSILAMFKGYYIAIANSNKKNYGALYPTLQKKFWLSYDQATVREMERRGDKLKGNLPVKKTQEIITEATTEVNKQIEAYNKAHKTKLPPFHAPPTPNDFELTFREQDVIPTGIKLRDKSKGLAAFRKAKLKPLTVEGAYAQSKFTPTAPAQPPVPPTAPPAPPSPPTPPPTQTSAATSPPPPPSTSTAPPAQPAPASPAQPALGPAYGKKPTPPAIKAVLMKYALFNLNTDNTMLAREMTFPAALFGGSEREGANRFRILLNNLANLADLSTHEGRLKRSQVNILRRCASFCETSSLMTHHLIAGGKKAFQSFESCNSQVFQEMTSIINAHKQFDRVLKQSFRRRALVEVKKEIETILIRSSVLQRGVLNDADIVSVLTTRNPNLSTASINNIVAAAKNLRNTSISKYAFIAHLENLTGWHSLRDSAGVQFNPAEYFSYTLEGRMMTPPMRQNWLAAATRARTRSLNTAPTLDTFVMWSMGWLERRTDTRFEGAFTGLSSTTVQTNVFDSITLRNLEVTGPNSRFPAGTNVDNIPLMREASATHFTAIDPATGEVVVYRVPTAKTDLSAADLFRYNETLNGSSAHFSPAFSSSVNPNSNVITVMMGEVLSFKLNEGRYAYSTSGSTPRFSMYRGQTRMGLSIPALTWSEIFSETGLTAPMRTDHLITHKNFTLKRGFELLVQHQIDRELGVTGVRPSVFFDGLREAALPLANGNRTLANHIEDGFDRIAYDYATYANNLPRLRPGTVGMLRQSGTSIIRIAKSPAWGLRSLAEVTLMLSKSAPELGVTQVIKNLGTMLKVYLYRPLTTESRTEITDTIFGIREYLQGARQQYLDDLDPDNPNLLEGLFGRIRRRDREQGMVGQGLEIAANLVSEIGSARNNTIFGRILSIQSNSSRLSRYILSGAARRLLNAYTPSVRAQMETLKQAGLTDARAAGNLSRMFKNIARQNGFSDWGDAATFNRFALLEKDTLDALEFIMSRVAGPNRGRIIGISELKRFVDEYCNNPLTGPIPKEQIKSAYANYVHALEILSYTQDAISESRGLNRAPTASEGQMFIRNLIGWSQSFFSNVMKNTMNRPALKGLGVLLFYAALTYASELLIERLHGRDWEDITEELGDSATVIFRIASSLPWGGGLMSGMATGALAGLSELLGGTFQGYGNPIVPPAISGLGSTAKQMTTMVRDLATKDLDTPEKIAVIVKGTPGISGIVNTSPFTIPMRFLLENNMLREAPALEQILKMQEWRNANKYTNRASSSSSYPNVKAQSKLDRDRELARMQAKYRQDTEEAAKLAAKQKTPARQKFNKDNELPKQPMSQPMGQPKVNSGVSSLLGNLL